MSRWEELVARIAGTVVPMTTPFTDSGEVDLEGVRENTRFLVESGIKVISPLGSTGEFYTMTQEEHWAVLKAICEEARGRATIIAGAGHSGTRIASQLTAMAHEAGADAALICVPYYKYDGAEGVYLHYRTIARENPGIGVVVYANREIMKDLSILDRLTAEPNIIGVKDATGDYALYRDESCGAHFREEHQNEEGEALRNDEEFAHVAAWEFSGVGEEPKLHKEQLEFHDVPLTQRSYK